MKAEHITITIGDKCFDLPKDIQIPEKGDVFFIEGFTGVVYQKNFHIIRGKVHMISIFAYKQ